jgi:hypothetical protein
MPVSLWFSGIAQGRGTWLIDSVLQAGLQVFAALAKAVIGQHVGMPSPGRPVMPAKHAKNFGQSCNHNYLFQKQARRDEPRRACFWTVIPQVCLR